MKPVMNIRHIQNAWSSWSSMRVLAYQEKSWTILLLSQRKFGTIFIVKYLQRSGVWITLRYQSPPSKLTDKLPVLKSCRLPTNFAVKWVTPTLGRCPETGHPQALLVRLRPCKQILEQCLKLSYGRSLKHTFSLAYFTMLCTVGRYDAEWRRY